MNKTLDRSRRRFLNFAGKTGIATPALAGSSLLSGLVANRYAQANNTPLKRVVFVYATLGAPNGYWLPSDGQLNRATLAYEGLQDVCRFHETYVVNGGTGLMHKALQELRWLPDWTGDTIDHQIAKVLGQTTPFNHLLFGVQTRFTDAYQSVSRKNLRFTPPLEHPQHTYDTLFGGDVNTSTSPFGRIQVKANIMDAHLDLLNCNQNKLSSDEKQTLQQYESNLLELKARLDLNSPAPQMCSAPAWNAAGFDTAGPTPEDPGNFSDQAALQADILTQALACGLTNVATLQLGDEMGSFKAHNLPFPENFHNSAHAGSPGGIYADFVNYLSGCIAYLIRQLQTTDDPAVPGTKLLDNTVVVQVTSDGDGESHSPYYGPHVIATQMPVFKTGLATRQSSGSDNHLRLLQTVAVGLGLEAYIGKENHHCIWPCGDGINTDLLA